MKSQHKSQKRDNKGNPVEPLRRGTSRSVTYKMTLFVAGGEPNSAMARQNLDAICEEHLSGRVDLAVIDIFEDYTAAIEENVLVTPALIVHTPKKIKFFGTLENTRKFLSALGLL